MATKVNAKGYVVYEGKSRFDGKPVVVIVTGLKKSRNRKTGAVLQTWILRSDISPVEALMTGADKSVCNNCPLRRKACYVNVGQAPLAVWRCYKAGGYETFDAAVHGEKLAGRKLRIGSYGDPAAIPVAVWKKLVKLADSHVGYTHAWRAKQGASLRGLVQASVDTEEEAAIAEARGWKYFRTSLTGEKRTWREVRCPAQGGKTTCEKCGLCRGSQASVVIQVHGLDHKIAAYTEKFATAS